MDIARILINLFWVILIVGGIIWSLLSIIKTVIKHIKVFFSKTIKVRKKNKLIVIGKIKDKKYYEPRGNISKPQHTDTPAMYEFIVEYEGREYTIGTNRKKYNSYEIQDSIELLLTQFLDYKGNIISYNLKIYK